MVFSLKADTAPGEILSELAEIVDGEKCVVGFGEFLLQTLGANKEGARTFPVSSNVSVDVPSKPVAQIAALVNEQGDSLDGGHLLLSNNGYMIWIMLNSWITKNATMS